MIPSQKNDFFFFLAYILFFYFTFYILYSIYNIHSNISHYLLQLILNRLIHHFLFYQNRCRYLNYEDNLVSNFTNFGFFVTFNFPSHWVNQNLLNSPHFLITKSLLNSDNCKDGNGWVFQLILIQYLNCMLILTHNNITINVAFPKHLCILIMLKKILNWLNEWI